VAVARSTKRWRVRQAPAAVPPELDPCTRGDERGRHQPHHPRVPRVCPDCRSPPL